MTLKVLDEIREGRIDLAFRRWRKPTVKAGGRLRTAIGELAIGAVDIVDPSAISDADARRAGFADAGRLRTELFRERPATGGRGRVARPTDESVVYRVEVAFGGADPRRELRETSMTEDELTTVLARLRRIDERAVIGPWTGRVLGLIAQWPGRRAPELAELEGRETLAFKTDIRKLKELGLTESLRIGYQLSLRGEQIVTALNAQNPGSTDKSRSPRVIRATSTVRGRPDYSRQAPKPAEHVEQPNKESEVHG